MKKLSYVVISALLVLSSCQSTKPMMVSAVPEEQPARWDLKELSASPEAFQAEADDLTNNVLPHLAAMAQAVKDAPSMLAYLKEKNRFSERFEKIDIYVSLRLSLDNTDVQAKKLQNTVDNLSDAFSKVNNKTSEMLFSQDKAFWDGILSDPLLSDYHYELTVLESEKEHTLTAKEEDALRPLQNAIDGFMNIHDTYLYGVMEYPKVKDPEGNMVEANLANRLAAMTNRDREYRETFANAFYTPFQKSAPFFAANISSYFKAEEANSKLHGWKSTFEKTLAPLGFNEEMYRTLLASAKEHVSLVGRMNDIRRRQLGFDVLYSYDIFMPLADMPVPHFTFSEAKGLVLSSLSVLGDDYTADLRRAFDEGWIDSAPGATKSTGAFAAQAGGHPWVLLNFTGDEYDLSTLAHELGHAMHMLRSEKAQPTRNRKDVTSFTSEIASITNELLLSSYMIDHAQTDKEKLFYVTQELDVLCSSFFTQMMFASIERQMRKTIEDGGTLTSDDLGAMFLDNLATFNPGVKNPDATASYWASIPHFYYDYYVFSYSTSIACACRVRDSILNGDKKMMDDYKAFLNAGNDRLPTDTIKMLGIDLSDPSYLEPLYKQFVQLLDSEEELLKKINQHS